MRSALCLCSFIFYLRDNFFLFAPRFVSFAFPPGHCLSRPRRMVNTAKSGVALCLARNYFHTNKKKTADDERTLSNIDLFSTSLHSAPFRGPFPSRCCSHVAAMSKGVASVACTGWEYIALWEFLLVCVLVFVYTHVLPHTTYNLIFILETFSVKCRIYIMHF